MLLRQLPGIKVDESETVSVPLNLALARHDIFEAPNINTDPDVAIPEKVGNLLLRSYQRDGVKFVLQRPGSIIADDLGIGKTLQSSVAAVLGGHKKVLVCGPLIARDVWCAEGGDPKKHLGLDVRPLMGRNRAGPEAFDGANWVFVHYDVIRDWFPFLITTFRPDCVIYDEAGLLKGRKTGRTTKARALARLSTVTRRILLSATPISNGLVEFWPLLDTACPDGFGSIVDFGIRYCEGVKGAYSWEFTSASNLEEFRARLSHVMIRRTRGAVMKELPPLTRRVIDVPISNWDRYNEIEHDVRAALGHITQGSERLVQITRLCSTLAKGKVKAGLAHALKVLETHDRIVVFTWFKETAKRMVIGLRKAGVETFGPVNGGMSLKKRIRLATELGETTAKKAAFVSTIGACEMAMNQLVAASAVIFNDLWWVPGTLLQAEGRIFRDGQKNPVDAFYLRCKGTIDEHMIRKLQDKAGTIEATGTGSSQVDQVGGLVDTLGGARDGNPLADLIEGLQALHQN